MRLMNIQNTIHTTKNYNFKRIKTQKIKNIIKLLEILEYKLFSRYEYKFLICIKCYKIKILFSVYCKLNTLKIIVS